MRTILFPILAALSAWIGIAGDGRAQSYPFNPVRMLVPYPPGGGADLLIRAISPKLGELLGQQIVIDNRPGGGSTIGTQIAAKSKPDGYTLLIVDLAYIVNPALIPRLPYDSLRDLVPVVALTSSSSALVVHPSVPAKTLKDLIALARARPGELNYASGGNGTGSHLAGELLKSVAKINIVQIPYKGTGPAVIDTVGGQVTLMFAAISAIKGFVETGRLRALAVTSTSRRPALPQVPTAAEAGLPGLESMTYRGLLAPAGTPREVILRINADANKALQDPTARLRLDELGYDPLGGTPEDYDHLLRAEISRWGKIIREAGIKLE